MTCTSLQDHIKNMELHIKLKCQNHVPVHMNEEEELDLLPGQTLVCTMKEPVV